MSLRNGLHPPFGRVTHLPQHFSAAVRARNFFGEKMRSLCNHMIQGAGTFQWKSTKNNRAG